MKKTLIIFLAFLSLNAVAQRNGPGQMDREKISAAKVAFLTERLNLDTKSAQDFWPIYNEYEAAKDALNKKFMATMKEEIGIENPRRGMENISEDQAEKMLQLMFEKRAQDFSLEREYIEKVAKVLSAKQTLTVSQFDAEFRRTLMKRYSEESRSRRGKQNNGN